MNKKIFEINKQIDSDNFQAYIERNGEKIVKELNKKKAKIFFDSFKEISKLHEDVFMEKEEDKKELFDAQTKLLHGLPSVTINRISASLRAKRIKAEEESLPSVKLLDELEKIDAHTVPKSTQDKIKKRAARKEMN